MCGGAADVSEPRRAEPTLDTRQPRGVSPFARRGSRHLRICGTWRLGHDSHSIPRRRHRPYHVPPESDVEPSSTEPQRRPIIRLFPVAPQAGRHGPRHRIFPSDPVTAMAVALPAFRRPRRPPRELARYHPWSPAPSSGRGPRAVRRPQGCPARWRLRFARSLLHAPAT